MRLVVLVLTIAAGVNFVVIREKKGFFVKHYQMCPHRVQSGTVTFKITKVSNVH